MKAKNLAVLFSGGKDSCLALHKVLKEGHKVLYLLNIFPKNNDSFMFHKPSLDLLARQAEELNIELIVQESEGEKEKELEDLESLIEPFSKEVEGIVVGGIASSYQGTRVEKVCDKFGLEFIAPILKYPPEDVWKELLKEKFEVIMTKISCDGLSKAWLGKTVGKDNFKELEKVAKRYQFRIDFEGGEAETAVLNMPEFKKKIRITFEVESEGEYRHWMKNLKVEKK